MTNASAILFAVLSWLTVMAPVAADTLPDGSADPAPKTGQANTSATDMPDGDTPSTCEYGCEEHREDTEICINKIQHRCGKKGWHPTGLTCADPPPVAK